MKNKLSLSLFLCLVILLSSGCSNSSKKAEQEKNLEEEYTGSLPEMSVYQLTSTWTNQNGKDIQLKSLRGKVVVAVMIYTSCTSACPILVQKVRTIHDSMTEGENNQIRYLFISIDPKDDTPEKLKAFAKKKDMDNSQFVFIRSSIENTRSLATVLGVNFKEVSKMDYKHSNIVSILDKNGRIKYQEKGLEINHTEVIDHLKKLTKN